MKTLEELNLKPKELLKVKRWLDSWYQHFEKMAQGDRASVERYDLEKLDFFFFTDCRDILSKKPESLGQESNESIRKRKRAVEYSLMFRFLLGEKLGRKRPCSHCGFHDRWINSLGDGTGHYVFCPKCKMTSIITYPEGYETCTKRVCEDLVKHGYAKKIAKEDMTPLPVSEAQKRIDEIQSYKYNYEKDFERFLSNTEKSKEEPKLPEEPPLKTVPAFLEKKKPHKYSHKMKKD